MKRPALAGMLAMAALLILSCGSRQDVRIQSQLTHYVSAQEALAGDDFQRAGTELESLAYQSEGKLKALAGRASVARDIVGMRDRFKALSHEFAARELPAGHRLAYCPVADNNQGAHWVQKDGQIMNPYFGASMLHCGVFTETP